MASSSYYWEMYREKKAEAKKYRKDREYMEGIWKALDRDFDGNVSDINKRLKRCEEKLAEGVRYVPSVTYRLDELESFREEEPDAPGLVSDTRGDIDAEARALRQKEEDAERDAAHYRELAQQAEAEERAEQAAKAAAAIKSVFGGG